MFYRLLAIEVNLLPGEEVKDESCKLASVVPDHKGQLGDERDDDVDGHQLNLAVSANLLANLHSQKNSNIVISLGQFSFKLKKIRFVKFCYSP